MVFVSLLSVFLLCVFFPHGCYGLSVIACVLGVRQHTVHVFVCVCVCLCVCQCVFVYDCSWLNGYVVLCVYLFVLVCM